MDLPSSLKKIELTFWDVIIRLLTDSPRVKQAVHKIGTLFRGKEFVWLAFLLFAWMLTGLILLFTLLA